MRPAAEGTFRLYLEVEGHHASNYYSLIPSTEFQILSVFLTLGRKQRGVVLSSTPSKTMGGVRHGKAGLRQVLG